MSKMPSKHRRKKPAQDARKKNAFTKLVENDFIRKVSYAEYREKVRDVYDGPQGAMLNVFSTLSLHRTLVERLLRERKFNLHGVRDILDVGSGAGQIAEHLLKYADSPARITCFDLSEKMIDRARKRLKSYRPRYLVADMTRLPFADESFDCVTCGYVLEHVPDPRLGLAELCRVMQPSARMLLITSEDNFGGACTSRLWGCQTYRRAELRQVCEEVGLHWKQELWFSKMHRLFRAGGICVELEKR